MLGGLTCSRNCCHKPITPHKPRSSGPVPRLKESDPLTASVKRGSSLSFFCMSTCARTSARGWFNGSAERPNAPAKRVGILTR
jgi:hypothetical protein